MANEISAIFLNGGSSRRMGQDKGLLKWNGEYLSDKILAELAELCDRILVVGEQKKINLSKAELIQEKWPGEGPLGAIISGLHQSNTLFNILAACDMPYLTAVFYRFLITEYGIGYQAIIPSLSGKLHPLSGVYLKEGLPALEKAFDIGERKMKAIPEIIPTKIVNLDPFPEFHSCLVNINYPNEWKALKNL